MSNTPYRISFVIREFEDSNGNLKKIWGRCGTAWINKDKEGNVKNVSLNFDYFPVPIKELVAFPQDEDEGKRTERTPF